MDDTLACINRCRRRRLRPGSRSIRGECRWSRDEKNPSGSPSTMVISPPSSGRTCLLAAGHPQLRGSKGVSVLIPADALCRRRKHRVRQAKKEEIQLDAGNVGLFMCKREARDPSVSSLQQEDEEGNVEYKYRLKEPNPIRLQKLVGAPLTTAPPQQHLLRHTSACTWGAAAQGSFVRITTFGVCTCRSRR